MPYHIKTKEINNLPQILSMDKVLNCLIEISNKINTVQMKMTTLRMNYPSNMCLYPEIKTFSLKSHYTKLFLLTLKLKLEKYQKQFIIDVSYFLL